MPLLFRRDALFAAGVLALAGRGNARGETVDAPFEVAAEFPHDSGAYSQGLVWDDSALFESTGRYGSIGSAPRGPAYRCRARLDPAPGHSVRRGTRAAGGQALSAHVGVEGGLCLRRGVTGPPGLDHLCGRGVGTGHGRRLALSQRRLGFRAGRRSGDLRDDAGHPRAPRELPSRQAQRAGIHRRRIVRERVRVGLGRPHRSGDGCRTPAPRFRRAVVAREAPLRCRCAERDREGPGPRPVAPDGQAVARYVLGAPHPRTLTIPT
ncbi:MAG: glutaminyl-peptide cyclotransferase [Gemmatimonadaceae bacterium]|nr:glutaminyl-peptide cyclotransferase [Gemmatimonadaceae bacterium]